MKKCLDADFHIEYVLKSWLKNALSTKNTLLNDSSVILNDDIWAHWGRRARGSGFDSTATGL